jgi:tetratricopeptide (TPR) repeat protein
MWAGVRPLINAEKPSEALKLIQEIEEREATIGGESLFRGGERSRLYRDLATLLHEQGESSTAVSLLNRALPKDGANLTQLIGPYELLESGATEAVLARIYSSSPEQEKAAKLLQASALRKLCHLLNRGELDLATGDEVSANAFIEGMRDLPEYQQAVEWCTDLLRTVKSGNYEQLSAALKARLDAYPEDAWLRYQWAIAELGSRDNLQYGQVCAEWATGIERSTERDMTSSCRLLYACVASPTALADYAPLASISEHCVAAQDIWLLRRAHGAVLFRAHRHEEALEWFTKAGAPAAWDLYFVAMIQKRLGQLNEAVATLERAKLLHARTAGTNQWYSNVEEELLEAEAQTLVHGNGPAENPKDD